MSKKHKNKKMIRMIDFHIYQGTLMYTQGLSWEEINDYLKRQREYGWMRLVEGSKEHFKSHTRSPYAGCAINDKLCQDRIDHKQEDKYKEYYCITIPEGIDPNDPNDMITLAHEALHICQMVLSKIMNRDEEYESEAYFQSYIMERIVEEIYDRPAVRKFKPL